MKRCLLICLLLLAINAIGQTHSEGYKPLNDLEIKERIANIPTQNGKILYDQVIVAPGMSANDLFVIIRNWFVEKFTDSRVVLEVNDPENGLMTGKGTYKFQKINGINAHVGYVSFIMNVKVKDGKFRYQLYTFVYKGVSKGMFADANDPGIEETVDMNDALNQFLLGKREKKNRKFLSDLVTLQDYFDKSLRFNVLKRDDISDF